MSGIVAIVGRPNVGKSTLFNRLQGERKAIVDDASGVTRDRHYGKSDWGNRDFTIIDTGGYVTGSDDVFETSIRAQVEIAISEADILIFMVDVTTDITTLDESFTRFLRKTDKPILVAVNKVDNHDRLNDYHQFYALGFEHVYPVSSISGSGTGELLDAVVSMLPPDVEEVEHDLPRISLIGRPNVGKSSLCNVLLGEERNIVTDIAGTTRDTIDSYYNAYGMEFTLVDTAGVRKKSKVMENIEFYSVMRSIKAIESSDVVLIVLDATAGMEAQDVNLFSLAAKNGKGIVILVNKWDLVEKDHKSTKHYTEEIQERMAPFTDVPVIFVSALTKQRVFKAVETAIDVYKNMNKRVPTHQLNEVLLPIIEEKPPPSKKGKYIKIKYVTQIKSRRIGFAFFCNLPQYVSESYRRFLENKLRQHFDFKGVPITIYFRKK
ncbi:MAG: ribosome biogenesis GTPase Der [Flavobacteriales bacterium]|nr:ribosome biogenesis GTPase Der [Bacteroidota bacterium]MCB9240629.1 ribosome biogenesis GTPase Der [Flavobacteriales bacterium]